MSPRLLRAAARSATLSMKQTSRLRLTDRFEVDQVAIARPDGGQAIAARSVGQGRQWYPHVTGRISEEHWRLSDTEEASHMLGRPCPGRPGPSDQCQPQRVLLIWPQLIKRVQQIHAIGLPMCHEVQRVADDCAVDEVERRILHAYDRHEHPTPPSGVTRTHAYLIAGKILRPMDFAVE
jgi:hypothetical protein